MFAGIKAYIGAALVLVVFGAGWMVNGWRLGKKIDHLQIDLVTAQTANAQLTAAVEEQHAAYRRLVTEARALEARLGEAEARGEQIRVEWRERIREIIRDAPPSTATCEEAILWARVQYGALLSSWF